MEEQSSKKLITYLNYKDIIIILGFWFFMAAIILIAKNLELKHLLLTSIFHFLFILCGRFFFLAIIIFYLTSLYPVNFKQMGIKLTPLREQIIYGFSKVLLLLTATLFIINIRLSFKENIVFTPLYEIKGPEYFMAALPPFLLVLSGAVFIALSEQFILNSIIYELFKNTLFNKLLSTILSALFYSVLIISFTPSRILMNFIAALISLLLYQRKNSLFPPTLFMAGYYTIMIFFVYGWRFMNF
ncbi:MAG: type II CAAX prenyl endopeptidase Rce1 family protein [Halanaerobiaceae bacterium]